ncbi:MAG TPA: polysaccharide biosynthesis C-terminal domain-containing protein [Chitinophagaceae bacterium]
MVPSISARIFYMGLMFLAGVLLAAIARPHDFGSISIIILNATLFYTLSGLGSESAILLSIGKKQWPVGKATTSIGYSFVFQFLVFAFLQWVLVTYGGKSLLSFKATDLLVYEFFYFTGLMLVEKYTVLFYAYNKAWICNILLSFSAFAYLASMLAFYFNWLKIDFHPFVIVALVTLVQGAVLITVFHLLKGISFVSLDREDWKGIFSISTLVLASNLVQLVAYRFDYWFMEAVLSTSEVGIYAQANRFAQLIWALPNIVSFILIPKLFKEESPGRFLSVLNTLNVSNLAISLAVMMISMFFYQMVLPSDYKDGLYLLFLMLPGYFLFACSIPIAAYFSTKGLLRLNLFGSILCLVLVVVLDIILIPLFGYWGAALGNLVAYSASALYLIFSLRNNSAVSIFSLLKLRFQYNMFNEFK